MLGQHMYTGTERKDKIVIKRVGAAGLLLPHRRGAMGEAPAHTPTPRWGVQGETRGDISETRTLWRGDRQ